MKVRIDRDVLRQALRTVLPAVDARPFLPVLNGVRFDTVDGDGIRLTCSNLDLTIACDVDAKVLGEGAVVVSAKLLSNLVDTLSSGAVELSLAEPSFHVSCLDTDADVHTLRLDDWPRVPVAGGDLVSLGEADVDLIRRVLPFASVDPGRPMLTGLMVTGTKAVATDSYRLAEATLSASLPDAIIPAAAVTTALKGAKSETVEVQIGDRFAAFHHNATTWTTVLIEEEIPAYDRLIPADPPHAIAFSGERMVEALKRVTVIEGFVIDPKTHAPKISLKPLTGAVSVGASMADVAEITDVVPADVDFDGTLNLNPGYLVQMISAAGTPEIRLRIVDSLRPVTVLADNLLLLQMPVRPPVGER